MLITREDVRIELQQRGVTCKLAILDGVMHRLNRGDYTLERAYREVIAYQESPFGWDEDGDVEEEDFDRFRCADGSAGRRRVDLDYHGECFHQGE